MRPNAKIGAANWYSVGMNAITSWCVETFHPISMRSAITRPFQNAEKLPATKPLRMLRLAPPCLDALTTSRTWRHVVDVNTFVNSGISAPAMVPQEMMIERIHHRSGRGRASALAAPAV